MMNMIIIGLGNPGKEYKKTRHNAGFMFVDYFWKNFREEFGPPTNFKSNSCKHTDQLIDRRVNFSDWELKKRLNAEISVGKSDKKKIILIKPQTFMNLSGAAVKAAKNYYKVKLENILVVHDEIDLPIGKYKFSNNSSSAGHKGVQNIIGALGTKNFARLRIGIDNRKDIKIATEKYVLGKFADTELKILKKTLVKSVNELIKITK